MSGGVLPDYTRAFGIGGKALPLVQWLGTTCTQVTDARGEVHVLLVDDDLGDVLLISGVLRALVPRLKLRVAHDGLQALAMLRQQGAFRGCPRPALVLLDLNMPGMDGQQVLATIKEDPGLKAIPVIILTTSAQDADIVRAYRTHANSYVTKPPTLNGLERALDNTCVFWLQTASLPA